MALAYAWPQRFLKCQGSEELKLAAQQVLLNFHGLIMALAHFINYG